MLSLVNTTLDTCKSDVDMCDENVDVKELEQAIKEIGSNKISGSDSLTLEFFKLFFYHSLKMHCPNFV